MTAGLDPRRKRSRLGVAVCLLAGVSCATDRPERRAWNDPEVVLSWPAPPERARIEYLGAIRSGNDVGQPAGLLARLSRWVLGSVETALVKPVAVAKNDSGLLVVGDPSVPTVHLFDLQENRYRQPPDEVASLLRSPVGVAVDRAGRVYVADSVVGRVFVLDREGRLVFTIGEGKLQRPTGVALSPGQERLYVVDTLACQVVILSPRGREIGRFGRRGGRPGEFNAPTHIAVAPNGTVGISDSLNFRVQLFRPDGTPVAAFGEPGDATGSFARPKGIAQDALGRLYVADAAFENVQIFDTDGTLLMTLGGPGRGPGAFNLPAGLFLDSDRTLWVADSFNRRIQAFRLLADQ